MTVIKIRDLTPYFHSTLSIENKVFLYGASYGGHFALLIACKYNVGRMFRAVVSHCGMSNLACYPFECSGNVCDVMNIYAGTDDRKEYLRIIKPKSPYANIRHLCVPVLFVHTLADACV